MAGRSAADFAKTFFTLLPVAILFNYKVASVTVVQGPSMKPTLNPSLDNRHNRGRPANFDTSPFRDWIVLDRISLRFIPLKRGEIVTFAAPDYVDVMVVKRVLALEGDLVRTRSHSSEFVRVPRGHVWVEGDNAAVSHDSNDYGPVPLALVTARARGVIWPPWRCGPLGPSFESETGAGSHVVLRADAGPPTVAAFPADDAIEAAAQ